MSCWFSATHFSQTAADIAFIPIGDTVFRINSASFLSKKKGDLKNPKEVTTPGAQLKPCWPGENFSGSSAKCQVLFYATPTAQYQKPHW